MEYQRVGPRSPESVKPLRRGRRRRVSIPAGVRRMVDEKTIMEKKEEVEEMLDDNPGSADEKAMEKESVNEKLETIQPPTSTAEEQTTYTQSQSLLFQKLPPELRSLIWRQCVGNYNIYLGIIADEKRIRHCKIFEGKGLMRLTMDQDEQDKLMEQHYFISLLQSCRRT
jgi:hypothetical protein